MNKPLEYEVCEHRTGQTGLGIRQEFFRTPCAHCEALKTPIFWAPLALLLAIIGLPAALLVWIIFF